MADATGEATAPPLRIAFDRRLIIAPRRAFRLTRGPTRSTKEPRKPGYLGNAGDLSGERSSSVEMT